MNNNMSIDEILSEIDDHLHAAKAVPFTGRGLVDVDAIGELIENIRYNLPSEIKNATGVVADRDNILNQARAEAEGIIKRAEARAQQLIAEEEILKQAKAEAAEIISQARKTEYEVTKAMIERITSRLSATEDVLGKSLGEIKSLLNSVKEVEKRTNN